jgi:hypothetical protein
MNRIFKIAALAVLSLLATSRVTHAQATFVESFDSGISTTSGTAGPPDLTSRGWVFRNQSTPPGAYAYFLVFPGLSFYPPANAGPNYIAVQSNATGGFTAPVSAWAILPPLAGQQAGDTFAFWANASLTSTSLEVRYSPTGGTSTGSGAAAVGNFTQVLGTVTANTGSWVQYQFTVPGAGRLAFRYTGTSKPIGTPADFIGIDTLSVGAPPVPPCNMPPVPTAGQTVHWTAAGGPYRLCQSITIVTGATVIVDPGVHVDADATRGISLQGTLRLAGTAAAPVVLTAPAVYPPLISVEGGTLQTSFAQIGGQVRPLANGTLSLADTTFAGPSGLIFADLFSGTGFATMDRVTFNNSELTLTNYTLSARGLTLNNSTGRLIRDYSFLSNVVIDGKPFDVDAALQGTTLDTITVRNVIGPPGGQTVSTGYGLGLNEGNFFIGPAASFSNNSFPLRIVSAGILPGSAVTPTGNINNSIYVPGRDHHADSIWADAGVPYFIPDFYAQHGGSLRILEGARLRIAAGAGMASDPSYVAILGTPEHPVTVEPAVAGQPWYPLQSFYRIRHATLDGAITAAAWPSQRGWGFMDSCVVRNATETGVTGQAIIRKTLFQNNAVGASVSFNQIDLTGETNPNAFEGNGGGVSAAGNAAFNWWNSPTGPTSPDNPGGTGDVKANGVPFQPFRTARPNFNDFPPIVALEHHAFLAKPGQKVILNWKARDDGQIVSQRITMVSDGDLVQGNLSEPVVVLAEGLPGAQRAFEFVMPEPGIRFFGAGNIRVEATDNAGQIGWDDLHIYSERSEQGQLVLTSPLQSAVVAGQNLGTVCWQAQGINPIGGSINAALQLENTDEWISLGGVTTYLGCLSGTLTAPFVSTDRARIVLSLFTGGGREQAEYYYGPVFSIRPDTRIGDAPPAILLSSPGNGAGFPGGQTVPLRWTAADDQSIRAFHVQQSTDGGRTWSFLARDLPGSSTGYDWALPTSTGIAAVQVKVVAVDRNFQDASALRIINLTPGVFIPPSACAADIGVQGGAPGQDGLLDNNDFVAFINYFFAQNTAADIGRQGGLVGSDQNWDNNDFIVFINQFFQGCP